MQKNEIRTTPSWEKIREKDFRWCKGWGEESVLGIELNYAIVLSISWKNIHTNPFIKDWLF